MKRCFHLWYNNINDHRWLSGYITRENQCHQNLQDHRWYPLFVMHDHWLFAVVTLQQKPDPSSCGSTSFYCYLRGLTRQFYQTFPTHLSRREVKGWPWPVINSRFQLRSAQSTDQASNGIKTYRWDRENEGTSQTTSLGDRFERISRRRCSTAPSADCPSTLAEYSATQIGFAWSSRRTGDGSSDNALEETNAAPLLSRFLARQRSVRFLWMTRSRRAGGQRFVISMPAVDFRRFNSLAFPILYFPWMNWLHMHWYLYRATRHFAVVGDGINASCASGITKAHRVTTFGSLLVWRGRMQLSDLVSHSIHYSRRIDLFFTSMTYSLQMAKNAQPCRQPALDSVFVSSVMLHRAINTLALSENDTHQPWRWTV